MHRSPRTPFEMQEFRREDSALKAKSFFGAQDRFKVITDILAIAKTGMTSARLSQGGTLPYRLRAGRQVRPRARARNRARRRPGPGSLSWIPLHASPRVRARARTLRYAKAGIWLGKSHAALPADEEEIAPLEEFERDAVRHASAGPAVASSASICSSVRGSGTAVPWHG